METVVSAGAVANLVAQALIDGKDTLRVHASESPADDSDGLTVVEVIPDADWVVVTLSDGAVFTAQINRIG